MTAMWPFRKKRPQPSTQRGASRSYDQASIAIFIGMVEDGDVGYVQSNVTQALANYAEPMFGQTVLMTAVLRGHVDIVRILLDAGADPNAKDKTGLTALDCVLRPEYDFPPATASEIGTLLRNSGGQGTKQHDRLLYRERQYSLTSHLEQANYFGDIDYRLAIHDATVPFPTVADAFDELSKRDRDSLSQDEQVFVDGYPRYLKFGVSLVNRFPAAFAAQQTR